MTDTATTTPRRKKVVVAATPDTTDCPYCAYNGDTVTTHNPVAHAENGDPNTREEEA